MHRRNHCSEKSHRKRLLLWFGSDRMQRNGRNCGQWNLCVPICVQGWSHNGQNGSGWFPEGMRHSDGHCLRSGIFISVSAFGALQQLLQRSSTNNLLQPAKGLLNKTENFSVYKHSKTEFWLHFWLHFDWIFWLLNVTKLWLRFDWILTAFQLHFDWILVEFWLHFSFIFTAFLLRFGCIFEVKL